MKNLYMLWVKIQGIWMPAMEETVTTPCYIVVSKDRIAGLSLEEWIENYKAERKTESQIQFFPIEENPNL